MSENPPRPNSVLSTLSIWRRRSAGKSDRTATSGWQAGLWSDLAPPAAGEAGGGVEGQLWSWATARRGLRVRLLLVLRWVLLSGQAAAVLWVGGVLHYHMPVLACLAVIGVGVAANVIMGLAWPGGRLATGLEAVLHLGFDVVQLSLLLALTGGLDNPFSILLVAPVVVAAATLNVRNALAVGAITLLMIAAMWFWSFPTPFSGRRPLHLPLLFELSNLIAIVAGILYTAIYAWQAQVEAQRMEVALAATQAVLAREQRLSALGGLAAAAAHELGTPLATIQVVTKEMARSLPEGSPSARMSTC